jgi:asparagine synthase (glutamine-hydrolysing)
MCGIIFTNQKYGNDFLEKTKYRGPDETRLINKNKWYLGFNRLAFQDISIAASQPMEFQDRYSFLFNGEIYNKYQLKNYLANVVLKSDSDTEILFLFLIEIITRKLPFEYFDKIDGIFSFILFDNIKNKIYYSRDRFGVKPLYLKQGIEEITFCSDYSFFQEVDISENSSLIVNYLHYPFSFDTATIFNNIIPIPKGILFSMDLNSNKIEIEHTSPIKINNYSSIPFKDIIKLKNDLQESINRNLIGDYPAVFLLSGGVDSSLIVSITANTNPQKIINTYSVNFNGDENSEKENQDLVLKKYKNIQNTNILIDQKHFIKKLNEYISLTKKLPVIPNEIALFILFEKIKIDGFRLVISGEGADEIFDGYSFISDAIKVNFLRSLGGFGKNIIKLFNYFGKGLRFNILLNNPLILFNNILIPDSKIINDKGYYNLNYIKTNLINTYLYSLLQRVDTSSMRNNIEVRVPFLSTQIFEYHLRKSSIFLNLFFSSKLYLRFILAKYVNFKLAFAPKKGFAIPWQKWYNDNSEFKFLWEETLQSHFIKKIISDENIDLNFNKHSLNSINVFFDNIGFRLISLYIKHQNQNQNA